MVADEVHGLRELSSTVRETGAAVTRPAKLSGRSSRCRSFGERVAATAMEVEHARQSAVESGRSSRESIENLAVLVGIAVGVIPSITLLGFYLPHRIALRREPPARPATR